MHSDRIIGAILMADNAYLNRRNFLKGSGAVIAGAPVSWSQTASHPSVAIIVDPADPVASAAPVQWAAHELQQALADTGVAVSRHDRVAQSGAGEFCVVVSGPVVVSRPSAASGFKTDVAIPNAPECLALAPATEAGRQLVLACGSDTRGAVYALLELADRVRLGPDPLAALQVAKPIVEQPANSIRSIQRLFSSDVEDKPWFNDREMWPHYLTMLAAQRFNRFNLSLGIGYDFLREVTDAYFLFAYPFLLSPPGYNVRAANLPDAERDRNLATLKFISEEDRRPRPALSVGHLDARLPVDQQPASQLHHRGPHRRQSRALLPRCAGHAAQSLPGHSGRDVPHSRRKRRG